MLEYFMAYANSVFMGRRTPTKLWKLLFIRIWAPSLSEVN
jgi:hypothetical protein